MRDYQLPYGKGHLDGGVLAALAPRVLESRLAGTRPVGSETAMVEAALAAPIGSPTLAELSAGKKNVVVIASDHTRPVPSKVIMPLLLREIRRGNPEADITILIATGCHRGTSRQELIDKFGEDLVAQERIVVHDCDHSEMAALGTLPSGGRLLLNHLAVEADLLVAEGFIEPHFFAGFSGGRKSVLPGVAARRCVMYNHNGRFIDDPRARTGVLEGNPIHRDMVYAARTAKLAFICNVVLNERHEVVFAAAGDLEQAHAAGCRFCRITAGSRRPWLTWW